jgi:hypothetical protein
VQDAAVQEHRREQTPQFTLGDQLVVFDPEGCRNVCPKKGLAAQLGNENKHIKGD